MTASEVFDPELLSKIRKVVDEGDTVLTLSRGNENRIGRIDEFGIEVTTDHSISRQGGSVLAPAWMFNDVWRELRTRTTVSRDEVDRTRLGRKVKRSSVVFAILEKLPEVAIAESRPLSLKLASD